MARGFSDARLDKKIWGTDSDSIISVLSRETAILESYIVNVSFKCETIRDAPRKSRKVHDGRAKTTVKQFTRAGLGLSMLVVSVVTVVAQQTRGNNQSGRTRYFYPFTGHLLRTFEHLESLFKSKCILEDGRNARWPS